jgi:cellulose synthase/poly-beta-1,6-N-acetylglucosamine synthase-like glycosyltransferase
MLTTVAVAAVIALTLLLMTYLAAWSTSQMAMAPVAAMFAWRHQRRNTRRARAMLDRLTTPPLVSVVVPAYNEELTVVESVRALLRLEYESEEIVVVNDGSSDGTLAALREAFLLVSAPLAFAQPLATAPVRGIYRSISEPGLVVVDKENGGCKADAVNAGVNAASGELVLVVDADTVLEPDALSRAVLPFVEDPATVAAGGNVGIINGGRIGDGRIAEVALPRSWLARFQIVEYMRAFLLFRLACASVNAVVLISGAFGLFRRDAVIVVGGYDPTAIGEDLDLTIRLQHHFRAHDQPVRIAFDPNPLGWTQAPEDWHSLRAQRCRWRRGLLQALWRHRGMIGNARFGAVGVGALPYVLVFEGLEPLLEIGGYAVIGAAALLGLLDWAYVGVMFVVSVLFGTAVTLTAVFVSDIATGRYMERRDLFLLVAAAVLESCGYRQLNSWWSCIGTAQALRRQSGWGAMKRRAFEA